VITKWDDKELIKEMRLAARRKMSELGKEMIREMKARVPRRSGKTRKSIKRQVRMSRDRKNIVLTIGSGWFIARLMETGTVNMRPRPWLRPVFDSWGPKILEKLGKGFLTSRSHVRGEE